MARTAKADKVRVSLSIQPCFFNTIDTISRCFVCVHTRKRHLSASLNVGDNHINVLR